MNIAIQAGIVKYKMDTSKTKLAYITNTYLPSVPILRRIFLGANWPFYITKDLM
jgi:hypothetical protein